MSATPPRRVGIVGFGHLGRFLCARIFDQPEESRTLSLAFVWNRTPLQSLPADSLSPEDAATRDRVVAAGLALSELSPAGIAACGGCDVIVEVAHPAILRAHGTWMLGVADVFVGSPTALADAGLERELRALASSASGSGSGSSSPSGVCHSVYVPAGALWGAEDIAKMADRGTLTGLSVTMKKHPSSFKLESDDMRARLQAYADDPAQTGEHVLYDGPVRALCPLAPNNVNTMACAAIAGHNIGGFDGTNARLVTDKSLTAHVIVIDVKGPQPADDSEGFFVSTTRSNPAAVGAVTGSATYVSFYSSLLKARGHAGGFHFC